MVVAISEIKESEASLRVRLGGLIPSSCERRSMMAEKDGRRAGSWDQQSLMRARSSGWTPSGILGNCSFTVTAYIICIEMLIQEVGGVKR